MTIKVKVAEAKTPLSELLVKVTVEAGEEVIISRGNEPVTLLVRIETQTDRRALLETIQAERVLRQPASAEEIKAWRDEGRR